MAEHDPGELVAGVERALEQLERLPDPAAREAATGAVQALLDLYGTGLERIVDAVAAVDDGALASAFGDDELVSHLLLVHGLHPVPLAERVAQALGEVRPYLDSHGGGAEVVSIDGAAVRVRLEGSCHGCPSSAATLKLAIENAIQKAAPEIEEVIAEEEPVAASGLLQIELAPGLTAGNGSSELPVVGEGSPAPGPPGEWEVAGTLSELSGGGQAVKEVAGQAILFLKIGGRAYGYRPICPCCESSLADAALEGVQLTCPGCGNRYDAVRAGRCLDLPQLHLEPVPLLVGEDGLVRVVLAVTA